MKLIVGLGNGDEYQGTRHNVGYDTVRTLAASHRVQWKRQVKGREPVAVYGEWKTPQRLARAVLPLTMMNRSGEALAAVAEWEIAPQEMLLVCDDVNLPLGMLRLRAQGSAGGHHGLESCLTHLGTEDVPRLRIGVGTHPLPEDLTDFVLSPFAKHERPIIRRAMRQAAGACELWITEGIEVAMNRVNGSTP